MGKMSFSKKLLRLGFNLVIFLIFLVAVALLILVYYFKLNDKLELMVISFSSSIIGGILVVYLISKKLVNLAGVKKVIENWGLTSIYRTKKEADKIIDGLLKNSEKEIDCIIFGEKNILAPYEKNICKKLASDFKVRILILTPDSPFLKPLEMELGIEKGKLVESVDNFIKWIEEVKSKTKKPEFVQLKLYKKVPMDFYLRVDGDIFTSPYLNGISNEETLTYHYQKKSQGFEYFKSYFEKLWLEN